VQLLQTGVVTFVAQTFMALRVYAMSGRNKRLIYGLSIFNIIQGIFSIVLMALPGNKGKSLFHDIGYLVNVSSSGIPVPDIHIDAYHSETHYHFALSRP
jgi:hypothetical protein